MHAFVVIAALALEALAPSPRHFQSGTELAGLFAKQVDRRLEVPEAEQREYGQRLADALAAAGLEHLPPQYVVLVDRDPYVQAVMLYWISPESEFLFVGASPASCGRLGEFEHFETPTGVFEHTVTHLDFRADGTKNEHGIRGYGVKGMRVYDFGWQKATRTWGKGGESYMRLQMHATDPDMLERRMGSPQSKGCIRIPATLNVFIDRYGLLDADYERAAREGKRFWVLRADRQPTAWSGRYLVVVDSERAQHPGWSAPGSR